MGWHAKLQQILDLGERSDQCYQLQSLVVGSSGKQLVPLKRGLDFKSLCMQQHSLVASPVTARHATRCDHQISQGNPDTGAGDQKQKNYNHLLGLIRPKAPNPVSV